MSDAFTLKFMMDFVMQFGPMGVVMIIWWCDRRDIKSILAQYKNDMDNHWLMYEKNVSLVKDYEKIAESLQTLVVTNTSAITKLYERIGKPK